MAPTPEELDQLLEEAKSLAKEDRDVAATELLSAYLRFRPEHAWAWCRYGELLRVIGLMPEAEHALQRTVDLKPDRPEPYVGLGMLHAKQGDRGAAEQYFAQACRLHADDIPGWLWTLRGANLAVAGRLDEAENAHRASLQCRDVYLDEAWLNLGYVLRAKGKYAEACKAFDRARNYDPADKGITRACRSMEEFDAAIKRAQQLTGRKEGGSDDPEAKD